MLGYVNWSSCFLGSIRAFLPGFVKAIPPVWRGWQNQGFSPHFGIDAPPSAPQFLSCMTSPGPSGSTVFRPSAARLFVFYAVLGFSTVCIAIGFIGHRSGSWGSQILMCAGMILPFSIIAAGIFSFFFPIKLTAEGIHAHSVWGLPCFIRWQDIKSARKFNLFILPWLRLYPADGSTVIWLALFQSAPAQFKLEIQRLAPPGSPILSHFE